MTTFTTATTIDDVLAALASGSRPIAGGTDLVVAARQGKAPLPDSLIAIDRIAELATIGAGPDGSLRIGSSVTHAILMIDPTIVSDYSAIADASALVGSPATRNVGTLGGNVMNGSPAMDAGAPLMVLGATALLRNTERTREVALTDLWLSPGRTSAQSDELCVAIHLPARAPRAGSAYVRLEYRRAMEIAIVGAAASVQLNDDHTIAAIHVALTAVAPTIISVAELDQLVGKPVTDGAAEVGRLASEQAVPISDLRASDRYRRHTIGLMARRAVEAAGRRASGETISVPVNRALGIGAAS